MSRILYVHVGPTKTGTTAIQNLLSKHDNSVIIYPKVGLWGPGSHHGLVYSLFNRTPRRKQVASDPRQLLDQIAEYTRYNNLNMLISSEELARSVGRRKKPQGDVTALIHTLLASIGSEDWEVEILFVCREHFERAASAYSQALKGNYETRGPDEFLLESIESLQYAAIADNLRESGFKVTALNYHPSRTSTMRLLAHIGFSPDQIPDSEWKNVSLSTKALIAKLAANRTMEPEDARQKFSVLLKKMPGYRAPAQFIFSPRAAARAETCFAADREFLRREFGIDLPELDPANRKSMFFLEPDDMADIAAIGEEFGAAAEPVVRVASDYLRK